MVCIFIKPEELNIQALISYIYIYIYIHPLRQIILRMLLLPSD